MSKAECLGKKVGWGTSVLLHGVILLAGGYLFTKQARPNPITMARSSTEVEIEEVSVPSQSSVPQVHTFPPTPSVLSEPAAVADAEPEELTSPSAVTLRSTKPVVARLTPSAVPSSKPLEALAATSGIQSSHPLYLQSPAPIYPAASQEAREMGRVIVLVTISPSGVVLQASLLQSSHYPRLDRAALQAIGHWKFQPALIGGVPIESRVEIPVSFELH